MYLSYFSHRLCKKLASAIEERLDDYEAGTASIDPSAEGLHLSGIQLGSPPHLADTSSEGDAENSIKLHQWLKIEPFMAADERVWTCLCHTLFYDYTSARWSEKTKKSVKERFFMTGAGFTPKVSNSLSRLW